MLIDIENILTSSGLGKGLERNGLRAWFCWERKALSFANFKSLFSFLFIKLERALPAGRFDMVTVVVCGEYRWFR